MSVLNMGSFRKEIIREYLRLNFPGCPKAAAEHFAEIVSTRAWKNTSLGTALGIVMRSSLRHNMTDYDTLLLTGIDRHEARRRVEPKVNKMIDEWKRRPHHQ